LKDLKNILVLLQLKLPKYECEFLGDRFCSYEFCRYSCCDKQTVFNTIEVKNCGVIRIYFRDGKILLYGEIEIINKYF
jgi:hypothetical protein